MAGCNWMNHCDSDFNDDESSHKVGKISRRKALRIRDVSRKSHGGYVYDYEDRKQAEDVLGDEYYD